MTYAFGNTANFGKTKTASPCARRLNMLRGSGFAAIYCLTVSALALADGRAFAQVNFDPVALENQLQEKVVLFASLPRGKPTLADPVTTQSVIAPQNAAPIRPHLLSVLPRSQPFARRDNMSGAVTSAPISLLPETDPAPQPPTKTALVTRAKNIGPDAAMPLRQVGLEGLT